MTRLLLPVAGFALGLLLAWCVTEGLHAREHLAQQLPQQQQEPIDLPADWARRDLEGRWVWFLKSTREKPLRFQSWVNHFEKQRDWELLEMIAIHHGWRVVSPVLAKHRAPQWIRVHVWHLTAHDSHNMDSSRSALETTTPGQVLAWLRRYRDRLPAAAKSVMQNLEKTVKPDGDGSKHLPPLETDRVLRLLEPGPAVVEFGLATRANPGITYVHQVERAISAFGLMSDLSRPADGRKKLLELTTHPVPAVRRAALLGYTRCNPATIPVDRFAAIANRDDENERVREAAVMALSYGNDPRAWVVVHGIAAEPSHPGWKAALSRVAGVGNPFSRDHLQLTLLRKHPELKDDAFVKEQLGRIPATLYNVVKPGPRVDAGRRILAIRQQLAMVIERSVFATRDEVALAASLRSWTISALAGITDEPGTAEAIKMLSRDFVASNKDATLTDAGRDLAAAALKFAGR